MTILLIVQLFLSVALFFLAYRERVISRSRKIALDEMREETAKLQEDLEECREIITNHRIYESATKEKIAALEEAKEKFRAISAEALEKNTTAFLQLAKETLEKYQERSKGDLDKKQQSLVDLFKPVKETLFRLDTSMKDIEKERKGDQASLNKQLEMMIDVERELRRETGVLVKALRTPNVRGQWGEMQLKRVVELSGMVNQCDFFAQSVEDRLRPDLLVRLPGGKQIIIDAKTPFEAYFEALSTDDEVIRKSKLKAHTRNIRQHIIALGKKAYWTKFDPTPEFVVLFLPSEAFFSAALEADPSLLEIGVDHGVILATPTTLIGLLRAIGHGWTQESLSRHAKEISDLGLELYKRISDMGMHWNKLGRSLSASVESYNKAVGSLESRVLVSARKFQTLGIEGDQPPPTHLVEQIARPLQAPEMVEQEESLDSKQLKAPEMVEQEESLDSKQLKAPEMVEQEESIEPKELKSAEILD